MSKLKFNSRIYSAIVFSVVGCLLLYIFNVTINYSAIGGLLFFVGWVRFSPDISLGLSLFLLGVIPFIGGIITTFILYRDQVYFVLLLLDSAPTNVTLSVSVGYGLMFCGIISFIWGFVTKNSDQ